MTTPVRPEASDTEARVLDALRALYGSHPGARALHAKGAVFTGTFAAAPAAAMLSRAQHFDGATYRTTVRLSNYAGIPTIADGDPGASPRGIAVRIHVDAHEFADILAHSYNGFPVATGEDFALFVRSFVPQSGDAPEPRPLARFLDEHPAAKAFALDPKPPPISFAHESFFGVNAFRFTNDLAETRYARYRFVPYLHGDRLDTHAASLLGPDFLFRELVERLRNGPVLWRMLAQLADEADPTDDATSPWPEDRVLIELGTLEIDAPVEDNAAAQRALAFSADHLVDGIALSNDPLLRFRPGVYAEGARRRRTGG
jgi:catalase